jgi:hypothetical protein
MSEANGGVALGKWVAGVLATVVAGVVTYVVIDQISKPRSPGLIVAAPSPSTTSPTPTLEQLRAALLSPYEVGTGFFRGSAEFVDLIAAYPDLYLNNGHSLDSADVARNRDCLSPKVPVFPAGTDPLASMTVERGSETVVQTLAAYDSSTAAHDAVASLTPWATKCKPFEYFGADGRRIILALVQPTDASHHGDETVAYTHIGVLEPSIGDRIARSGVVVTVRIGAVVCQIWQMVPLNFSFNFGGVATPDVAVTYADLDAVVDAAYVKLTRTLGR